MATAITLHRAAWREEHPRAGQLRAMAAFRRGRARHSITLRSRVEELKRPTILYRVRVAWESLALNQPHQACRARPLVASPRSAAASPARWRSR
jgi:hypothetical protein